MFEGHARVSYVSGEISGEATRKGVARAGGVVNVLEREGGAAEKLGFGTEEEASVLAFLDCDIGGAHFADFFASFDEARFAGELAGFTVVKDEHVHTADEAGEGVFGDVDPEVHRIRDDEARLADLVEHMVLEVWRDVGQEDDRGLAVGLGEGGGEGLENIQLHRAGLARVHVPHVFAGPAEGFSGNNLQAFEVDAAAAEEVDVLLREILADDADEAYRRETRCGNGAVGSGAAEEVFVFGELSFDVIQPDGANDKNGHRLRTMGKWDAAIQKIIRRFFRG